MDITDSAPSCGFSNFHLWGADCVANDLAVAKTGWRDHGSLYFESCMNY